MKNGKNTALLTGYAYETIPNKPIVTGKTKGPDATTEGPDAMLTAPTSRPLSLGLLAVGAPGISDQAAEGTQEDVG